MKLNQEKALSERLNNHIDALCRKLKQGKNKRCNWATFHERNNRKHLPALLLSAYVGRWRFAKYQCSTQVLGTAWKYSH